MEEKRPDYYKVGVEVWDFIQAWGLDFFEGNIVKYIARAGLKTDSKLADYEKALTYAKNIPAQRHSCWYDAPNDIDLGEFIDSWDLSYREGKVIDNVIGIALACKQGDYHEIVKAKQELITSIEALVSREVALNES